MATLSREELTLLALALARGRPLTRIYLQKAVYMLQQELPKDQEVVIANPYDFKPSKYGAYTPAIYPVTLSYAEQGYLELADMRGDKWPFQFAALQEGVKQGLALLLRLPRYLRSNARGFVEWIESFPTVTSLASAMYDLYPDSAINTVLDYIPRRPNDPVRRLEAIRPVELFSPALDALRWIRAATGLSDSAIVALIGVNLDTLSLWREGYPIEYSEAQRIQDIFALLKTAERNYHTPDKLKAWLSTPQGTSMQSPRELIMKGHLDTAMSLTGSERQSIALAAISPKTIHRPMEAPSLEEKAYMPVIHHPVREVQAFYHHQGRKKPRRFQVDE